MDSGQIIVDSITSVAGISGGVYLINRVLELIKDGRKKKSTKELSCLDCSKKIEANEHEIGAVKFSLDELRGRHERFDDGITKKLDDTNGKLDKAIGSLEVWMMMKK